MSATTTADAAPFDALAARYDATFTDRPLGRRLRQRVWSALEPALAPGSRALDLGCGTGEDACFLASRGLHVTAIDRSSGMIDVAGEKLDQLLAEADGAANEVRVRLDLGRAAPGVRAPQAGVAPGARMRDARADGPSTHRDRPPDPLRASGRVTLHVGDIEALDDLLPTGPDDPPFDLILSSFGVLNCVTDWPALGRALAARTRPGSRLVLGVMGPACAWEWAWYGVRGDLRRALRRLRPAGVTADLGAGPLTVRYPRPATLAGALGPAFEVTRTRALGWLLPPTYAAGWLERRPDWLARLDRLDQRWSDHPLAVALADHYLLELTRVDPGSR